MIPGRVGGNESDSGDGLSVSDRMSVRSSGPDEVVPDVAKDGIGSKE